MIPRSHSKRLNEAVTLASLLELLRGKFSVDIFNKVKQIIPKSKLIIFFSSTFTDTHDERNIVMEELLPELQSQAQAHGVLVTFVDMRFGVKDENTKDHMTWLVMSFI